MPTGRIIKAQVQCGMLLLILLALASPATGQTITPPGAPWVWVSLGQAKVKAEVVSTPHELYQGLSYRANLPQGKGMLFVLPEVAHQVFCMRGMRFPLDLIWIVDGRVAGITRNVPPTFPGELPSPRPVNYVLEVPGGFAAKHGIEAGDRVKW